MEFSTEKIKPLAEELADIIGRELNEEGDIKERQIEEKIRKRLQELGQMTFGIVLSRADDVPEQEIPCECGGMLHYQRRRPAKVLSVFDWVEYKRSYYAGCTCGKGKAPLDEKLGLEPGQVTAGLAALLGMTGIELAFEYSGRWLEPFLLLAVSENTIRKETQQFGELQAERENKLIKQSQDIAYLQERLRTETDLPERMYGSIDGAQVRIEERNQDEKNTEKWREMKVGCWYTVEPVPNNHQTKRHRKKKTIGQQVLRAKGIRYFCDIAEVDEFEPLFQASACQEKVDLASEVVFVCDGAKWIWGLVERNFPHAVQIIDWYHAEERLENVARDVFTEDKAVPWLDDVLTALWYGDTHFVITACEKLASQSEIASQAFTYFRNNAHRMHYDRYRENGYMIGSGTVESGCKQIVTHRLKRSGAQWNLNGAILTAKARAAWLSGDWEILCALRDRLPLAI
ncbi:MAG: ISKra4 family transposase [Anaerolineales bacterium]|nr:ISKra4 family transposase [Chloroflexota bacterium]MBL6982381.1 ISKra4 family transposase [Anaerolineales bacterium]